MSDTSDNPNFVDKSSVQRGPTGVTSRRLRRRRLIATRWLATIGALGLAGAVWLGFKATTITSELDAASQLVLQVKQDIAENKQQQAVSDVDQLRSHTSAAREATSDPLWTLVSAVPGLGANFSAITEVARSADDVATLGLTPLAKVFNSLKWESLIPGPTKTNLEPIQDASPSVSSAAHAVRMSAERLQHIDATALLPQVAEPLEAVREQLKQVTGALTASADASQLAAGMLGADGPRNYLLMIQNNAEARASGGIPGALAVLSLDNGKLTLGAQSNAGDVGIMSPPLPVDPEQRQVYSGRLGKFMQDVNLTPDFPTAASTAQAMWERKTGLRVDGVISLDPVALSYLLAATGPVKITSPELVALAGSGLPMELTGSNVVRTLLSDVYSKIERPELQDVYFAGVAKEVFGALSSGKGNPKGLIEGIARGSAEGRVLLWSGLAHEESVIVKYSLGGSITGPSISPAQFGVYFNDGTGAKMDYYVKRTVQLLQECSRDGYLQIKVRVTSTNTAPADAATSLPPYVTGAGAFDVPPGTVQTNIVAYGPVQSHVETAAADGKKIGFASHIHSGRPVGAVTVALPPGKSSIVEFTFGKIVQHTEPKLSVTPTVQPLKDVILGTVPADCVPFS